MKFKKHNWSSYGRRGMRVDIKVFDEDNRQLDRMSWAATDKDSERRIFTILKNSYGIFRKLKSQESKSSSISKDNN